MKTERSVRHRRCRWTCSLGLSLLLAGVAAGEATPTATPTPAPSPRSGKKSLAEAAREINAGKPTPAKTAIVITNETVAANAGKGRVTSAKPSTDAAPAPAATAAADVDPKREHWRQTYKDQLQVIADMEAEIATLDLEIPKLWSDFYTWDDPAYRDGVIKVEVDAAMARRDELQKRLPAEKEKPAKILAAARRDGALPGWFRDLD